MKTKFITLINILAFLQGSLSFAKPSIQTEEAPQLLEQTPQTNKENPEEEEHDPYHDRMVGIKGKHNQKTADAFGLTSDEIAPNPKVHFTKADKDLPLIGVSPEDLSTLWTIMMRTGQERLHVSGNRISRSGYVSKSKIARGIGASSIHMITDPWPWLKQKADSLMRSVKGKSRFDLIYPLENLVARVSNKVMQDLANGKGTLDEQQKLAHLLLGATNSLNSLYAIYKFSPKKTFPFAKKKMSSDKFFQKFATILDNLQIVIDALKYDTKTLPWQRGFIKTSVDGIEYLDLGDNPDQYVDHLDQVTRNTSINRLSRYMPHPMASAHYQNDHKGRRIALILVHGTDAGATTHEVKGKAKTDGQLGKNYYKDGEPVFTQVQNVAQEMANHQGEPVDLISFGWSGANIREHRQVAGMELAHFVREYLPEDTYRLVFLSHSHGGNVTLHAAQVLKGIRTPDYIVNIATPSSYDFQTDNFLNLVNLYSTNDGVQWAGTFDFERDDVMKTKKHFRTVSREDIEKFADDPFRKNSSKIASVYNLKMTYDHHDPILEREDSKFTEKKKKKKKKFKIRAKKSKLKTAIETHSAMMHCVAILPVILTEVFTSHPEGADLDVNLNNMRALVDPDYHSGAGLLYKLSDDETKTSFKQYLKPMKKHYKAVEVEITETAQAH